MSLPDARPLRDDDPPHPQEADAAAAREALETVVGRMSIFAPELRVIRDYLTALEAEVAVLKDVERLDVELRYAAATIDLVGRHRDEAIEERNELRAEVERLRELCAEVGRSGVEYEARKYLVVQLDPGTFAECTAIAAALPPSAPTGKQL